MRSKRRARPQSGAFTQGFYGCLGAGCAIVTLISALIFLLALAA